ncbi:MAG: response regulator transcription factor [Acidobacteriaceae bacterium]|nr:response regulator transcription factor [Acidobacteriaceae bacterium]
MQKILIVDDDPEVRETLSLLLERERFVTVQAVDGQSGFEKALAARPNLVLIDPRLPGLNGIEVCKQLRANRFTRPIIVVSAAADEIEKVLLLEVGADDYIVKPFGSRELLARIRAVLRRTCDDRERVIRFGSVEIDLERRTVTRASKEVKITPGEYKLLMFFIQNAECVLTRDAILDSVWGSEYFSNTRTVDAHVLKLRQKFEDDPAVPKHFLTVHRLGYRFLR